MKHLFIVSRSHETRGGADRIVADLCKGLPSRGWSVTLGLTCGQRFNRMENFTRLYPALPVLKLDGSLGTGIARVKAIQKAVRRLRPDVVLSMRVFDTIQAVSSLTVATRPRLVYGVRALEAPYLQDVRTYAAVLDGCVTSGKLIARLCERYGGMEAERVFSIGGGVRPVTVLRHGAGKTGSPLRLLYAGRLEAQQKRVFDFVPFLEALDNLGVAYQMEIVGAGPAEEDLRAALTLWRDRGSVRLRGWVSPEELREEIYPSADLFIHPAGWEGMTIAPREAMAHGVVPVISGFSGLVAEGLFVDGKNAMVFPVGDMQAAAQRVAEADQNREQLAGLSQAACNSQQGAYSEEGALDVWADALDSVAQLPPKQGTAVFPAEKYPGRLGRLGLSMRAEHRLRTIFRQRIRHQDPGSEWPTASSMPDASVLEQIDRLAEELDAPARET